MVRCRIGETNQAGAAHMDTITSTSIAIAFLGLLCLMIGYTNRDRGYGVFLLWGGVMCMLSVIVYYILRTLQ